MLLTMHPIPLPHTLHFYILIYSLFFTGQITQKRNNKTDAVNSFSLLSKLTLFTIHYAWNE